MWNSRNSREKKVPSTTVFTMSESHKVVNYLMQTKWNISQCQNRLFTFMCKFLQRSTCWAPQRERQRGGSTCATSQLRLCDVSSWSPARLSVSNTFFFNKKWMLFKLIQCFYSKFYFFHSIVAVNSFLLGFTGPTGQHVQAKPGENQSVLCGHGSRKILKKIQWKQGN